MFEDHEAALRAASPEPGGWIGRIVEYRNGLTHHPVAKERPSLDRLELVRCNYVLRILLELCFLRSMAIDASGITTLAERCPRYQQVGKRFFSG